MKQHMGILLNTSVLKRELLRSPVFEKIYLYERFAKIYDVEPIYFDLAGIDLEKQMVRGYIWDQDKRRFRRVRRPLPRVIHNRLLTSRRKMNKKLKRLSEHPDITVFNPVINRNKLFLHQYLYENEGIRPHLPETYSFNEENLLRMQNEPALFIKPAVGSIGRGIFLLEKMDDKRHRYLSFRKKTGILRSKHLYTGLRKITRSRPYLIQKAVPLAKYKGHPFDLRVTVQKIEKDRWTVTGMVAKVAPAGSVLTNLGRGGHAVSFDKAIDHAFSEKNEKERKKIRENVERLALSICEHLELKWTTLADIGLDIGLDSNGKAWFIEANVRDQRYSFLSAGEHELFHRTYRYPVQYARHLLDQVAGKS